MKKFSPKKLVDKAQAHNHGCIRVRASLRGTVRVWRSPFPHNKNKNKTKSKTIQQVQGVENKINVTRAPKPSYVGHMKVGKEANVVIILNKIMLNFFKSNNFKIKMS